MAKGDFQELLWRFKNNNIIIRVEGSKDLWQIRYAYNVPEGQERNYKLYQNIAPLDTEYLTAIRNFAIYFGPNGSDYIHSDLCWIYEMVSDKIDRNNMESIRQYVAKRYKDILSIEHLLYLLHTYLILYCTMTAEYHYIRSNGKKSILKKSVKMLAIKQTLYSDMQISDIADFSKNMSISIFTEECAKYGFNWRDSLEKPRNNKLSDIALY